MLFFWSLYLYTFNKIHCCVLTSHFSFLCSFFFLLSFSFFVLESIVQYLALYPVLSYPIQCIYFIYYKADGIPISTKIVSLKWRSSLFLLLTITILLASSQLSYSYNTLRAITFSTHMSSAITFAPPWRS